MAFKEMAGASARIESEVVEFENKGDIVEGYLYETFTGTSKKTGKEFTKYTFKTDDGFVACFGGAMLNRILPQVEPGTLVRITYLGLQKTSNGNKAKNFKVEVDNENVIEVAASPVRQTAAEVIASAKASA